MTSDNECMHGLNQTNIEIKSKDSPEGLLVPALLHKNCPGLAVTMHPFGCFTVTHTATGYSVCSTYERAASALLTMSQFALVATMSRKSWASLNTESAFNMIREAGQDEVPFGDCTSTSQGVTRKMTVSEWFQAVRTPFPGEFPWEEVDPYELAIENLERAA